MSAALAFCVGLVSTNRHDLNSDDDEIRYCQKTFNSKQDSPMKKNNPRDGSIITLIVNHSNANLSRRNIRRLFQLGRAHANWRNGRLYGC
jgi:hypothetical protein